MVIDNHSKIQITKILAKNGKVIDEAKIVAKKITIKKRREKNFEKGSKKIGY